MSRIELMPWSAAKDEAQRIRFAVFVDEQRVPAELEVDEIDAQCVHALAFHENQAIGTGRLLPDGHIGRMAVMKAWRGRGVGGAILQRLIQAAWERGDRKVLLSAQLHALPFYQRHRFVAYGGVYDEAGIPHQAMRLTLR
jgi:predicted GNAT family N-acyltransferase